MASTTVRRATDDIGLDMQSITDVMGGIVSGKENEIDLLLTGDDTSFDDSATVLELQQLMNEWSFCVGMQSSMIKTVSDACKSMVQKVS